MVDEFEQAIFWIQTVVYENQFGNYVLTQL